MMRKILHPSRDELVASADSIRRYTDLNRSARAKAIDAAFTKLDDETTCKELNAEQVARMRSSRAQA